MRNLIQTISWSLTLCGVLSAFVSTAVAAPNSPTSRSTPPIRVILPPGLTTTPLTGRLLILFAPPDVRAHADIRLDLAPTPETIAFFGQNVIAWQPGQTVTLSADASGFPYSKLTELPPGRYRLQASFERYESYRRADGRELRLPVIETLGRSTTALDLPRRWHSAAEDILWDGQQAPRTLTLSTPVIDAPVFKETRWVKSLQIRSQRLSDFWGQDIFLGAFVTLPVGYEQHSTFRYPWVIRLGGLPRTPSDWREQPPDSGLSVSSPEWRAQQAAWENFQYWQAESTPRMVVAELQHPTPYADSSLATNSLNNGPYADAIRHELIPAIETAFRVEPAGWARVLSGIADGAWSALTLQIRDPQAFNGVWAACPDPIDFRHFGLVDLQQDVNASFINGRHLRLSRAARRNHAGNTLATLADLSRWESALADQSRSREIWDRWEAAFSPPSPAGYPLPLWHPETGVIDGDVAEHWYQQHDLLGVLQRHSPEGLAALRGKLRLRIGDRDAYFFDNAVRGFVATIKSTHPELDLSVDYGEGFAECWTGRHDWPPEDARQRYLQDILPWAFERAIQAAPAGIGTTR